MDAGGEGIDRPAPCTEESGAGGAGVTEGDSAPSHPPGPLAQLRRLVRGIRDNDDSLVEGAVLGLSGSHRVLAPLTLLLGAIGMLVEGIRLLFSNWRLTLLQALPAMWIWLATLDLKLHVLHGKTLYVLRGPVLVPIVLAIIAITAASYFLNAVFAFAVSRPGPPEIRPAVAEARSHLFPVLASGAIVGFLLGLATTVVTRWGHWWFVISLSVVLAIMMITYVAVPSRLIGIRAVHSTRDKVKATALAGALGTIVCTPPYLVGRIGILMLGSHILFVPGLFVLTLGVALQAGATSTVKAIKMSSKLIAGRRPT
ncbi:MAG TPA: hypothetical protein VMU76_02780 [Acidimicrobiales bacterium]|nr:hypothetical protein [Acidimicrobiales bacterium]